MTATRRSLHVGLTALAATAVTGLAACGGTGSPSVARVATTTSHTADASRAGLGSTQSGTRQQNGLKYARCMRANGVPAFPDPNADGGFLLHHGPGLEPSSPTFRAAQAKCLKYLGPGLAPGTQTHPSSHWLAQMLSVAGCMRAHGISGFPDPRTSIPATPPARGLIANMDGVVFVLPASLHMKSAPSRVPPRHAGSRRVAVS